ncbi:MAG: hypothetical protein AB7V77_00850 [Candidatus Woesearchaeota archaeon]
MAKKSTSQLRKEEMHEFILKNTICDYIQPNEEKPFIFEIENRNQQPIFLHAINTQKEFIDLLDYHEIKNPRLLNTLRKNDMLMFSKLVQYVVELNEEGIIPAFIFNNSISKFAQTNPDKRKDKKINSPGASKQFPITNTPIYHERILSKPELVYWSLVNVGLKLGAVHIPHIEGLYLPEVLVYNPNKNKHCVEVNWYRHKNDDYETKYRNIETCIACGKMEGEDHSKCKHTKIHKAFKKYEKEARYNKLLHIAREIYSKDSTVEGVEKGLEFEKKAINKELIKNVYLEDLKLKNYFLAILK